MIGVPLGLFGTHVLKRADDGAQLGVRRQGSGETLGTDHARHAEVEDLRLAVLVDQDIRGLQIAVDHVLLMGMMHGLRHRGDEGHAVADADAVSGDVFVERQSVHQFHDEIGLRPRSRISCAALVDARDAGVTQSSQGLNFNREPPEQLCRHLVGANELQRDPSLGLRL